MAEAAESFAFPVVPCAHVDRGEGFAAARDLQVLLMSPAQPCFCMAEGTAKQCCCSLTWLQAGELVLRVAPLAAVPKDAYITRVCANCFQPGHPSSCSAGTSAPAGPLPSHTGSHAEGTGGAGSAVVAAAGAEPAAPSALKLCTACEAVSYCSRCLRLEKVQANHKQVRRCSGTSNDSSSLPGGQWLFEYVPAGCCVTNQASGCPDLLA